MYEIKWRFGEEKKYRIMDGERLVCVVEGTEQDARDKVQELILDREQAGWQAEQDREENI